MHLDRDPVVAGQFYAGNQAEWLETVRGFLQGQEREALSRLVMVPHAGHVFSGGVAGKTLAQAHLTDTVLAAWSQPYRNGGCIGGLAGWKVEPARCISGCG